MVNFELSCELMKGRGILIPFERLNPKYSDHALLFSFFFLHGRQFFLQALDNIRFSRSSLRIKPLCVRPSAVYHVVHDGSDL